MPLLERKPVVAGGCGGLHLGFPAGKRPGLALSFGVGPSVIVERIQLDSAVPHDESHRGGIRQGNGYRIGADPRLPSVSSDNQDETIGGDRDLMSRGSGVSLALSFGVGSSVIVERGPGYRSVFPNEEGR